MIYPNFIKPGNCIGVTATSAGSNDNIHLNRLESAISKFTEKGYKIFETENVRTDYKKRSSSKEERAKQFMELIENKNVAAIIAARGGEFLVEILPYINFEKIHENPKWVQGYSDTTGLGFCITTISDVATIYGENFGSFGRKPWHLGLEKNLELLQGKNIVQESYEKYQEGWQEEVTGLEPLNLNKPVKWVNARNEQEIVLEGRLIGGCTDILLSIVGTKFDKVVSFCEKYKQDGIVWFFDNCELTSEEILRGLWQLKESGWLKYAKGFIFGRTLTRKSNVGIEFEEAVMEVLEELNLPIIFSADIGHVSPQLTLVNGALCNIKSSNGKGTIEFKYE